MLAMHKTILLLAVAFSSILASPQAAPGTGVALGEKCNPNISNVCAGGAQCYAVNSMVIPICGNFQSICVSDAQCAFYLCNNGRCNGIKPSSTSSAPAITTALSVSSSTTSRPKPTGTNLPLGADCDPAVPLQCANGVDCYATNVMLIPRCGNFQAACKNDTQCANYKCNNGFCNGIISSYTTTTPATSPTDSGTSTLPSDYAANNATTSQTPSPSSPPSATNIGAAMNVKSKSSGFLGIIFALFLL